MRKYADRNSKVELDKGTMPLSDCAMQSILSQNKLIISRVPLMCVCAPNRTMMILYCTSQCQCPTISPTLASLICLKEGRQKMQKTQNQWNTDSTEAARAMQRFESSTSCVGVRLRLECRYTSWNNCNIRRLIMFVFDKHSHRTFLSNSCRCLQNCGKYASRVKNRGGQIT